MYLIELIISILSIFWRYLCANSCRTTWRSPSKTFLKISCRSKTTSVCCWRRRASASLSSYCSVSVSDWHGLSVNMSYQNHYCRFHRAVFRGLASERRYLLDSQNVAGKRQGRHLSDLQWRRKPRCESGQRWSGKVCQDFFPRAAGARVQRGRHRSTGPPVVRKSY